MDKMINWSSLLDGKVSVDDATPLLSRTAEDLHTLLTARPQSEQQVLDILNKRLGGKINVDTWQDLDNSLIYFLGQDIADLVAWVTQKEQANRLQALEKNVSPQVIAFLRRILGLYGSELERAQSVSNQFPDAWLNIHRYVYYDEYTQRYLLRVSIDKFNGEQITIEGRPNSILELVSYMMDMPLQVATPDAFSQEVIDVFVDNTKQMLKVLRPDLAKLLDTQDVQGSGGQPKLEPANETS